MRHISRLFVLFFAGLVCAPTSWATASLVATAGTAAIDGWGPPNAMHSNAVTFTITAAPPPAPTSPAGYWTFDAADITGNSVLDRSGNGLTGTLSANATSVPGKINQALQFAGGYVAVADAVSLQLRHDLTLTGWINASPQSSAQNFISKYDFSGAETGYILQLLPSGVMNLHIGGNNLVSGGRDARDTTVIGDARWRHIAVVITVGQDVKFYVDGQLSSTQPQVTMASGHTTPLYLGTLPGAYTGGPFGGSLDEIRIYSVALSASDIAALAAL